jgi:Right handed beta helix region
MFQRTEFLRSTLVCLLFLVLLLFLNCGSPGSHPIDIQKAVDAGGTVKFPAGTYVLNDTIVVRKSNTIIEGEGDRTIFLFQPTPPARHCINDRAFTTPCDAADKPRRRISAPIAIGDTSFTTADNVDDLQPGDWLMVMERDGQPGEVVIFDWMEVASAFKNTVNTKTPFRVAFPNLRPWDSIRSGLGFYLTSKPVEGVQFRSFQISVPDSGINAPGISVFAAKDTTIDNVTVHDVHGQPLYSYLSKGLTIQNCRTFGNQVLSEFAATVEMSIKNNVFSGATTAVGLDFGSAFFALDQNTVPVSADSGIYLLYGVHDGTVNNNSVGFVNSQSSAIGILVRGTQNVTITGNTLEGGAGPASKGVSIGPEYQADQTLWSSGNVIAPNSFGPSWAYDYDPENLP